MVVLFEPKFKLIHYPSAAELARLRMRLGESAPTDQAAALSASGRPAGGLRALPGLSAIRLQATPLARPDPPEGLPRPIPTLSAGVSAILRVAKARKKDRVANHAALEHQHRRSPGLRMALCNDTEGVSRG
jgi:hypothetical protein